uniref:NADH dehydrogenase subunit 6 n=2 Tax=Heterorhabditis TaxID=37861 RepID=A0A302_HETBA|nr:NADH dehydrogenase subunit 6 [Heterorhabditis indica]YP_817449.1 NADH dehydrogenase subunit 6 [Heterorhabditis bacteriophora]ABJ80693.1 NADH dehydrogenase subunit 6 [Heterorhabditis bacteriophora]AZU95934.1 NADH dehydrogenase subunit 6 [Heterorhabditis bacteriophora]QAA11079.1 NADH dehydrogenase subunit 6 [Heterorhabditis indica]QAA11091.1 NADH dehydrogenase subunit 6 [Heterorhabditis bacteriophora]
MFWFFFVVSLVFSVLSYLNFDPMKSSFFLVFSLIFSTPLMSFGMHVWFSYFVCLLFLSGVFVILVYFSSLSKISISKGYLSVFCFVLSFLFLVPSFMPELSYLSMTGFYFSVYWFIFFYVVMMLLFFMNFSSYFLGFSGALRKF